MHDLQGQIKQLAEEGKFDKIVEVIEQIPEDEWDFETIGAYVRALNNTGRAAQALEVSMRDQYRKQGENDALWHYRLGYAYADLARYDEAETVLLRAKELNADDAQLMEWIDELFEWMEDEKKEVAERKAESEALRRALFFPSLKP